MSSKKVAGIISNWNKGDARDLPEEMQAKVINLWKVIEIKKGLDFMLETIDYLEEIEKEKAWA